MLNAASIATNWANGMSGSVEKMKQGIMAVSVSPTEAAASAVDRQVAGVQAAAASGKTARNLRAVSLQAWQQAAINKGSTRIAGGAQAAKPKFQAFMERFIPHLQSGQAALISTPRGSLEQNIARANAMMRHNAQFKNNG